MAPPTTPDRPAAPPNPGARTVRVPDDRAGQRLDNFLLGQLKGAPRSLVYKLVRSGQVRVDGGRAKTNTRLEPGQAVRVPPLMGATSAEIGAAPSPERGGPGRGRTGPSSGRVDPLPTSPLQGEGRSAGGAWVSSSSRSRTNQA